MLARITGNYFLSVAAFFLFLENHWTLVRISVGRGKEGFYRPAFLGLKYLFRQPGKPGRAESIFRLGTTNSEAEETDSGLLMIGCIKS